ncbi:MAG: potassium channel family protein, partial [Marinirhabdus sp.]
MLQKILRSKILVAVLLLMLIFTVGVLGYKFISHYTWVDAFYMTVITITTVGYGTIGELDPVEKLFTSLLILSSIFIVGYAIKVISEYVLTENNIGGFKQKRAQKKINMLKNHVIVCGYGRNGKQAVLKLLAYGKPFVIVEVDEDLIEKHSGDATLLFVEGDATHDGTLFTAGIARAA